MKKRKRLWASVLTFGMTMALVLSPLQMAAAAEEVQPLEEKEPVTYYALSQVPENIRQLAGTKEDDGRLIKVTNVYDDEKTLRSSLYTLELFDPVEGTGQVLMFGAPVKYLDDNGDIRFIDTSLKSMGGFRSLFTGYVYENQANDFTVRYASSAYQGYSIDDQFRLSVKDDGTGSAQNAVVEQQENGAGSVKYGDAFGTGTYVEYINTEGGVKENIVLSENVGKNRFDFTFRSADYHPVLTEDQQYVLIVSNQDPQEVIYRFSSLYAYDSYQGSGEEAGGESEADPSAFRHLNEECYYELAQDSDGSYTVTAVVPEDYLNHPEVVYPVTIDPSMGDFTPELDVTNGSISDSFTYAGTPTAVYSNEDFIRVGETASGKYIGYVCFDGFYNHVPYTSYIMEATITLTYREGQTSGCRINGSLVTDMWYNSSITHNNSPGYTSAYDDVGHIERKPNSNIYDYTYFDVTKMASMWHNSDTYENAGMRMEYAVSTYDTNGLVSANGDASRAPKMSVWYSTFQQLPSGLVNYGVYSIRNAVSGEYLDTTFDNTADGTTVQTTPGGGWDPYCWQISCDSGYLMIASTKTSSRTVLLDGRSNCVPGALVSLYGKDSRTNFYGVYFTHSSQLWRLERVYGNNYNIYIKRDRTMCLSVSDSVKTASGRKQVIMDKAYGLGDKAAAQQWVLERKP